MIAPDLMIEYPLIKLPYELAVRSFKNSKKMVEKEISHILNQIIKLKNQQYLDQQETTDTIRALIARLKELKLKLKDNYKEQDQIFESTKKRIVYLNETIKEKPQNYLCYHKNRLNRLIIDYLVRLGHLKTAQKIASEYKIEDLTQMEIQVIQEANVVLQDLKKNSCVEALKWCTLNKSKLQKINSSLEFQLIFQSFIELVKKNSIQEAVIYIHQNKDNIKLQNFDTIKQAMGCLAMHQSTIKIPKYQYFYDKERWNDIIKMFKQENYNIFGLSTQSPLNLILQAGICSLKTVFCFDPKFQKIQECPTCNQLIQKIAQKLPSTLKVISSFICRISGQIMDENNPPYILPNGQVYSQNALQEMASKNQGIIIDPITQFQYKIEDTQRIYLS